MISNRFRWGLRREITAHINHVIVHTAKSLKDRDNKPLDAAPLYIHLFGSLTPISINFDWPPQTQALTLLLEAERASPEITAIKAFRLPKVDEKRTMLRLPISAAPGIGTPGLSPFVRENHQEWIAIPNSMSTQPLGIFTAGHGGTIDNIALFENERTPCITPELIRHVRRAIIDVYGEEVMDAIDRVSEITRRIRDLDDRVTDYLQNVKSVGALFKMLPPLLSLSRVAASVHHIKIAREAIPPSPDLLSDLNLLASLASATGAKS